MAVPFVMNLIIKDFTPFHLRVTALVNRRGFPACFLHLPMSSGHEKSDLLQNSLLVQSLGLPAFTAAARVQSLVREVASHKPRGVAKVIIIIIIMIIIITTIIILIQSTYSKKNSNIETLD